MNAETILGKIETRKNQAKKVRAALATLRKMESELDNTCDLCHECGQKNWIDEPEARLRMSVNAVNKKLHSIAVRMDDDVHDLYKELAETV